MIINNEIRIKYKIKKKLELYLVLNDIQKDIRNYKKKKDDREKQRKN